MAKDPVCGMKIDEANTSGHSEYQGRTDYFCSKGCKTAFDPLRAKPHEPLPHASGARGGACP